MKLWLWKITISQYSTIHFWGPHNLWNSENLLNRWKCCSWYNVFSVKMLFWYWPVLNSSKIVIIIRYNFLIFYNSDLQCTDTEGSFTCACNPGYQDTAINGVQACVNIDECATPSTPPCATDSSCIDTRARFKASFIFLVDILWDRNVCLCGSDKREESM